MKALSIRADYVFDILVGDKTQEFRSWQTAYRGKLLLCTTVKKIPGYRTRNLYGGPCGYSKTRRSVVCVGDRQC